MDYEPLTIPGMYLQYSIPIPNSSGDSPAALARQAAAVAVGCWAGSHPAVGDAWWEKMGILLGICLKIG